MNAQLLSGVQPRRKCNLLIVASSLWIGGAETVIRHLAESIDRKRFNVTVCCLKQRGTVGDELAMAGIDVVEICDAREPQVDYFTFMKLRKVIRSRRIDIVHTHTAHGLVDAGLCSMLNWRLKVAHTFHFGNYPHTAPRIIWMEHIFSRVADRLFSVGEVQRKQIKTVYRLPDHRIKTIYNGVSIRTGAGDPVFRSRVSAENCLLIGTIATLIDQKGLTYLLDVAKVISDSGRKVRFVIVGEGHLRAALEAKRRELGLEETVILTGWVANAADVALPTFDIFFQPSLWEAMSMVVLEAMAAGKAIVATRVGENGRIIEDGIDGLLSEPMDVLGMAAALGRVIDDAALRVRLGQAARAKIEQTFTIQQMVNAYEAVYEELVG